MIKILHTADLHLDSPFSGVSLATGEELRRKLRDCFCRIVAMAKDGGYDAIFAAGDIFDCGFVSPETVTLVRDAFADFARPVIIAPGNHDPYLPGSIWAVTQWSDNVYIFKTDRLSFFDIEIGGAPVRVWGWGFMSDRLDSSPLSEGIETPAGRIGLICAHADTASPISKYAPSPLSLFAKGGCAYAALGHIHNPPEPAVSGLTLVAYSGFPEGRSFDEPHFGGVLSVSIPEDGAVPTLEKISVGSHRYESLSVDVTGEDLDAAVAGRLIGAIKAAGFGEETSLRIAIEGAVPTDYTPHLDAISAAVSAECPLCSLSLKDKTLPVYSADELANDLTIRGALYRSLLPRLSSADSEEREIAAAALRIGLLALDGKAFL